jgi:Spy/CpxP family protein refolding chaperone
MSSFFKNQKRTTMKKMLLVLIGICSINAATAQNGKGGQPKATPEQRAQKSVDHLDKTVTLTADQKTQVYNLALSRAQKVDGIRTKYKGQPEQRETAKKEIRAAHKEYALAVKPLLTPEQLAALKAKRKANKGNAKGKNTKTKEDAPLTEEEVQELIPAEE